MCLGLALALAVVLVLSIQLVLLHDRLRSLLSQVCNAWTLHRDAVWAIVVQFLAFLPHVLGLLGAASFEVWGGIWGSEGCGVIGGLVFYRNVCKEEEEVSKKNSLIRFEKLALPINRNCSCNSESQLQANSDLPISSLEEAMVEAIAEWSWL